MKSYEQVRQILSAIEPGEETYSQLDTEDLPHLKRMLHDVEPWRAARAIHAAARLSSTDAQSMITGATSDTRREVRAAVAAVAMRLPQNASNIVLDSLLDDHDLSIKKLAIKSVGPNPSAALLNKLKTLSDTSGNTHIKKLASDRLRINR